jgi:hypothetical protein
MLGVEDILKSESVKSELLAELFDDLDVMDAAQVNPTD